MLKLKHRLEPCFNFGGRKIFNHWIMFIDYWKMSDKELEQLARKYNLRGFLEETIVLTDDRKVGTDFVINRRDVIEQLSQRDNRNIAFWSAVVAVLGAIISLLANFL